MAKRTILIVDDDHNAVLVLGRMLGDLGQLRFATSGEQALQLIEHSPPDLIFLDVEMPGMDGLEVCRRLKARPELTDVPIIFVTSHDDEQQELLGLDAGAVDFISKPPRGALVNARARVHLRLKELSDALRHAATTDGLTGVANRRQFDQALALEWARMLRSERPTSLLMIDVDHFKAYNDRYGHPQGDQCLRQIAGALQSVSRRVTDLVARYGGEEFAVLLPETDQRGAEHLARLVIQSVAALALPHEGSSVSRHVTISVGLSTCALSSGAFGAPRASLSARMGSGELVRCADLALYAAKRGGRNGAFALAVAPGGSTEPTRVAPEGAGGNAEGDRA